MPEKPTEATIRLFLRDAIACGLRYNLGPVEAEHACSDVRAERLGAPKWPPPQELDQLTANRVKNEVSPEIDSLRAEVERQSTEQRLTDAIKLEIDKPTFALITGLATDQDFELTDKPSSANFSRLTLEAATADALRGRADLASCHSPKL